MPFVSSTLLQYGLQHATQLFQEVIDDKPSPKNGGPSSSSPAAASARVKDEELCWIELASMMERLGRMLETFFVNDPPNQGSLGGVEKVSVSLILR